MLRRDILRYYEHSKNSIFLAILPSDHPSWSQERYVIIVPLENPHTKCIASNHLRFTAITFAAGQFVFVAPRRRWRQLSLRWWLVPYHWHVLVPTIEWDTGSNGDANNGITSKMITKKSSVQEMFSQSDGTIPKWKFNWNKNIVKRVWFLMRSKKRISLWRWDLSFESVTA